MLKCGIIWPFVATMYEGSVKVALHGTAQLNSYTQTYHWDSREPLSPEAI